VNIAIDEDRCIGAGQCVLAAPEVFDQRDDDGIAVLLDASPSENQRPQVEQAISVCPALAIKAAP